MPTSCAIDFVNNPHKVVFAGQLLCGTIKLTLTDEKRVHSGYIRIYGEAYCHWTNGFGKTRRSCTGREEYLDETIYFISERDGGVKLAPGEHSHLFQINLPPDLPSSIEGGIGYIRYTISVVLDIPTGHDKEFKEQFTVLKCLDLNADHILRAPISVEDICTFYLGGFLCCFKLGSIEITVNVPVGGYTPGQTINLGIHVKNSSSLPIPNFNVHLVKRISFTAEKDVCCCNSNIGSNEKIVRIPVASKETQGCSEHSVEVIRADLNIPPIPPTDSTLSDILSVSYYLRISATLSWCHLNPVFRIPITIGTNPIRNFAPSVPTTSTSSIPHSSQTFDGPPNYAEAIFLTNLSSRSDFRPKYPMFERSTCYSNGI